MSGIALFTDPVGAEARELAGEEAPPSPVLLLGYVQAENGGLLCIVADEQGFQHVTGLSYVRLNYRRDEDGDWVDGDAPHDPDAPEPG